MAENYLPPDMMQEGLRKLEFEFYEQYGQTLASWARLEQAFCSLFCALCNFGAERSLGRALFFSGRSFNTRAALIGAAARSNDLEESEKEVMRALLKKARQFETARNKIAHGYPVHLIRRDTVWQGWRIKEGDEHTEPGGIGLNELQNAAGNFLRLELLANRCASLVMHKRAGLKPPLEEYLAPIRSLPNDALLPSEARTAEEQG